MILYLVAKYNSTSVVVDSHTFFVSSFCNNLNHFQLAYYANYIQLNICYCTITKPTTSWLSGRVLAFCVGGPGFKPRLGHTKDSLAHSANKGSDLGSNLATDWRPVQGGTLFSVASCHGNRG